MCVYIYIYVCVNMCVWTSLNGLPSYALHLPRYRFIDTSTRIWLHTHAHTLLCRNHQPHVKNEANSWVPDGQLQWITGTDTHTHAHMHVLMPPSCWPLWNSHVTIKRLHGPNLLFRAPPQTLICIIGKTSVERVKERWREARTEKGERDEDGIKEDEERASRSHGGWRTEGGKAGWWWGKKQSRKYRGGVRDERAGRAESREGEEG